MEREMEKRLRQTRAYLRLSATDLAIMGEPVLSDAATQLAGRLALCLDDHLEPDVEWLKSNAAVLRRRILELEEENRELKASLNTPNVGK